MHVDMACLKLILENVRLNLEKDDVIKWKGDNDGMFTVKNFFFARLEESKKLPYREWNKWVRVEERITVTN